MSVEHPVELAVRTEHEGESHERVVQATRDGDKLVLARDGLVVLEVPLDDLEAVCRLLQGERVVEAREGEWDCDSLGHLYTLGHRSCAMCDHEAPAGSG